MNSIQARCGHSIPAIGSPGSLARRAAESRTCGRFRCESGLAAKFTEDECEAYCWLRRMGVRGWSVDMVTKDVVLERDGKSERFASLVSAANQCGKPEGEVQ